jgi:flagellar biosynthesis GTPase FlhF
MEDNNIKNEGQENQEQTQEQNEGVEKVEMTKEELQKLLQQEGDKRVSSAMKKAQEKWEADYKAKLEKEKTEAEKLAKMSEEEKFKAQLDKEKAEFEAERKKFLQEKLALETVKQLSELGLPTKFSDFIVRETAEETKANLDAFANAWNEEMKARIEKEVEERLKGTTPKKSNGGNPSMMTKKEFGLLSPQERMKMMEENPDLVKQILSQK